MLTSELKSSTKYTLFLGLLFLFVGIVLYLRSNEGITQEKIGLVLFTCGALFVGVAYTLFVAWKQSKQLKEEISPTTDRDDKLKLQSKKWKDILIYVFIFVIIVETVILLLQKSFGSISFDYDLFKQILLVIIPIAGGTISAYKVTNSWQIYRDKVRMKSEILELFDQTVPQANVILHQFMLDIITSYGKNIPATFNQETAKSNMKIIIPTKSEDQPKIKFNEKFEKLKNEIPKTTTYNHKFLSKLRLYCMNTELENRWYNLDKRSSYLKSLVYNIMDSTSTEEFVKHATEYDSKRDELDKLLKQFKIDLANTKIRNIPV
ncbi:MAG TPA: hypothetical protein VJ571_01690 [Candidatus Nitrosotalea sp.]|nr:hypothetical protein [Candidatus Nitrosotalea sp.]